MVHGWADVTASVQLRFVSTGRLLRARFTGPDAPRGRTASLARGHSRVPGEWPVRSPTAERGLLSRFAGPPKIQRTAIC